MKWLAPWALLLLASSFAFGDLKQGLMVHLDWIQKKVNGAPQCLEDQALSPEKVQSLAELCMTQVCGPAEQVTSDVELALLLIRDPEFYKRNSSLVATMDKIDILLDNVGKKRELTLQGYQDLKKGGDLALPLPYQRMRDLAAFMNEFNRAVYEMGTDLKRPLLINKVETRARLTDLSERQKDWVVGSLDHFIRSPLGGEFILWSMVPPEKFLEIKHPKKSFSEALAKEGLKIQKMARALLNDSKKRAVIETLREVDVLTDPLIQKAANHQNMDEAEIFEFMRIRNDVLLTT